MKSFAVFLGLSLSASVFANQNRYRYVEVPHADIDQHLVIGSDATGTPEALQGLWWLDGNPVPDKVISFASTNFQEIIVDGELVGHEAFLPVYDEGVWSWHNDDKGWETYERVRKGRLTYHLVFDPSFNHGDITIQTKVYPIGFRIEIPKLPLLNFTMDKVNEDEYRRDTTLLISRSNYRFRRIVDGEGNRLPAYDEYLVSLRDLGLEYALIPVCTLPNPTKQLPSPCAKR